MPKPQIFPVSLKLLWVQFSGDSGLVALQREGPFFAKPQFSVGQYYSYVSLCMPLSCISFLKITSLGPDSNPESFQAFVDI